MPTATRTPSLAKSALPTMVRARRPECDQGQDPHSLAAVFLPLFDAPQTLRMPWASSEETPTRATGRTWSGWAHTRP